MNSLQALSQRIRRYFRTAPPREALHAELALDLPDEILRGCPAKLHVEILNRGSETWPARGAHRVELISRWLDHQGILICEGDVFPLHGKLGSGRFRSQMLTLIPPPYLGDYLLEVELRQRNTCNLDSRGHVARAPVRVNDPTWNDCDYVEWYQREDLTKNHWRIVGPTTREEHDRIQQAQFQILLDQGLTPDSAILDIGCGTGKLAAILHPYLSGNGCYFGTDIGKEGVLYCQDRFARENFHFQVSEPDAIPITDQKFDLIVLFSVFTHTYPEVTEALLRESAQVLKPDGIILADVICSSLTRSCVGRRGAIEINESLFLELATRQNLSAESLTSLCHSWHRFAQRKFFRFTSRDA